jgi:predicted GNAT family acetyltransferase
MQVHHHAEVADFLAVADAFLRREPARNQLPIAIAHTLSTQPEVYPDFRLWTVEDDGVVVGAAARTPPHNVALADPSDPVAIDALVDVIANEDTQAPGVVGNRPHCGRFADRWISRSGQVARVSVAQGVFELTEVVPPRPAPGSARKATLDDGELVHAWFGAFADEALPPELAERSRQHSRLDLQLAETDEVGGIWLWEEGGEARSVTGSSVIPVGARIGPVYTPPAERGRGFASNLVAHVSGLALDSAAAACFLYTDLANPTSNKIYTDVGYVMICRSDNIEFAEA